LGGEDHFMNIKQKITLSGAALVFILSFILAPWEVTVRDGQEIQHSKTQAAPLWAAPAVEYGTARLRVEVLVLEWVAISIVAACLSLLLGGGAKSGGDETLAPPKPGSVDGQGAGPAEEESREKIVGGSKAPNTNAFLWVILGAMAMGGLLFCGIWAGVALKARYILL
jgi:hypothetical protein